MSVPEQQVDNKRPDDHRRKLQPVTRSRFFCRAHWPILRYSGSAQDESASKNQTLIPLTLKNGSSIAEGLWIKRLMRGAGDIAISCPKRAERASP